MDQGTNIELKNLSRVNEIMRSDSPAYLGAFLLLVLGMAGGGLIWASVYRVETVVRASGVIRPQKDPVSVQSATDGTIDKENVEPGNRVSKGDLLIQLDTESIKNDLNRVKLRRENKRTRLKDLNKYRESLVEERRLNEQKYKTRLKRLRRELDQAEEEVRQKKKLLEKDVISKEEYRNARERKEEIQSDIDETRTNRHIERQKLTRRIRKTEMDINNVKNKLKQLKQRIQLLAYRKSKSRITAPKKGVILEGNPQVGDVLSPGQLICRIGSVDELRADLIVPESERDRIRTDQEVSMTVSSFPERQYQPLTGTVYFISPDLKMKEGQKRAGYLVKVRMDRGNYLDRLEPGMTVKARLKTGEEKIISMLAKQIRGAVDF